MEKLNSNYIEKIILKGMLNSKDFLVLVGSVFEEVFFDDPYIRHSFKFCKEYSEKYNSIPSKDSIINSSEKSKEIKEIIEQVEQIDFDVSKSYEFLLEQANDYLKEKAIKQAIIDSVDDVEIPEKRGIIQKRIENALIKDIKIDLGLNYFDELGARLKRIFTATDDRIPTYFPAFDEVINGGFPSLTLNAIAAKIHGCKSNFMANCASRQLLNGHNVVLLTLEMSEDAFAQRFDSIFTCLDINRMYLSRKYRIKLQSALKKVKEQENRGKLFIKQYPTGTASILDFRMYLRELQLRDIRIDIVYVDYINLMKTAYKNKGSMYEDIKAICEELRALSFEFKCPFVSVSQINREGFYTSFSELSFNHMAESMGIGSTVDFLTILGTCEQQMVYESEILYKIVKSRIGGRIGEIGKFYLDKRSLKMYDESEIDLWTEDSTISGDSRNTVDKKE